MGGDQGRYVSATSAASITGIPERTIRKWVEAGKVAAIAGKRGKLVDLDQLRAIAEETGRPATQGRQIAGNAIEAARFAGNVAVDQQPAALDIAALQLARIEALAGQVRDQQHEIERLNRLLAEKALPATASSSADGVQVDDRRPSYVALAWRRLRSGDGG